MYSLCLCLKEGNHDMHLPDTAWKIWEEEDEKEEEVLIASRCMCVWSTFSMSPSILCRRFVNRRCQFLWWDLGVDRFCDWPLGWIGLNRIIIRSRVPSLVIGPLTEQGLTLKENTNNKIQQDARNRKNAHESLESHLSPFRVHFNFIPTDWLC